MRWATGPTRAAALLTLALLITSLLLPGGIAAQSAAPPSGPPTPSPRASTEWPLMRFDGGDPAQLVFTSDCGVWGRDPITLTGAGGAGSAVHVVTFDTYDSEAAQWFGRVTGTYTGTNGITVPVDDAALIYYDFDLGRWMLVAGMAGQIPGARVRIGVTLGGAPLTSLVAVTKWGEQGRPATIVPIPPRSAIAPEPLPA